MTLSALTAVLYQLPLNPYIIYDDLPLLLITNGAVSDRLAMLACKRQLRNAVYSIVRQVKVARVADNVLVDKHC